MPHSTILITTIAVSLGLALIMGMLANRLKLPVLVGYLVAGMMIGPFTPGFVADLALSNQLAEIGVILLMFGVGLHFSLSDLLAVRKIALPGAIAQIIVATLLGASIAMTWEWNLGASIVFGLALSVASTVVLIRALEQRGLMKSINGRIAVGWLIVEDLVVVLALVLLPPLAGWLGGQGDDSSTSNNITDLLIVLAITFVKVSIFIGFMLIVGKRLFPWLLWHVASTKSNELFILCVIAVAVAFGFVLIMAGFLLQWPTLITIVLFPLLVTMYVKLARREERDAATEFGDEYQTWASRTPAFVPHWPHGGASRKHEVGEHELSH